MDYRNSILGLISVGFFGFILGRAFRFGMNFIIGRLYGAEALGYFTIGVLVIHLGAVFCSFGLGRGSQRILSGVNKKAPSMIQGTIFSAVFLSFLISVTFSSILFIYWDVVLSIAGVSKQNSLWVYLLGIPLFTVLNVIAFSTRGFGETKYFVYIKEISQAGVAFVIILGLGLASSSPRYIAVGYITSMLVGATVAIFIILNLMEFDLQSPWNFNPVSLLKISVPLMFIAASNYFLTWIDTAVLSIYKTPTAVGMYQSAYLYAAITPFAFQAINSIFPHVAAKYYSSGDRQRLERIYSSLTLWGTSITMLAGAFLIIFATELLSLFSSEFTIASTSLRILTVGFIMSILSGPAAHILSMTDFEQIEAINSVLLGGINMVLNIVLVPMYGIVGAAIATSISLGTLNIIRILEVYKLLNIHPYSRSYIWAGVSLVLPITILYVSGQFIELIGSIFSVGVVSTLMFFYTSYQLGLFNESDIILEEI